MALDGIYLNILKRDIEELVGARVDKIYQPSREELVITMRSRTGGCKLLLSAGASSPRIHFTNIPLENPKVPPMFCMLMRKHLSTARLSNVRQFGMDRILFLDFETVNELGDMVTITIIIEIMGRHSNIIAINQDGKIIDAIKRVTEEMSSVRSILPGINYELPPTQNKLSLFDFDETAALSAFAKLDNIAFYKAIMQVFEGISPILARELAYRATGGLKLLKNEISDYRYKRLFDFMHALGAQINARENKYTMLLEDSRPKDFTFMDVEQFDSDIKRQEFDSASLLLDSFYSERDRVSRMKQRSHDLLKLLVNTTDRIERKLLAQRQELLESTNRDTYKIYGDLLNANLYAFSKGESEVTVQNFYADGYPMVTIPLDLRLTPSRNAQKYFSEYRKAKTAEQKLKTLIADSEQELIYLDSIFDALTRTTGESELLEIREELSEQGYLRNYRNKLKMMKALPPIEYLSTDGFTILCGRNNKQNDKLTLKQANGRDLWLHTQKIAGSHVIVLADGKEIPDTTIEQAAMIAAYNSHARESAKVPVDYTFVRNVKKPNGAKPGMVIFVDYKTAYVTPNEQLVTSLLASK